MKSLILTMVCAFISCISCQNIPVKSAYGTAFVDPEELLETTLAHVLYPQGVLKVDVDRLRGSNNAGFEVELYTPMGESDPDLQSILDKALTNDLKFTGVTVRSDTPTGNFFTKIYANKSRFYVSFNPNTVFQEMQTLAEETMKTTYIELEDDQWD